MLSVNGSVHVHVVDDDQNIRTHIRELLEPLEINVSTYHDAQEFHEKYSPADISGCLILDLRMPRMTGLELLERLKQRGSPLPVIMISAHADVPTAVRAMRLGALDFLEKPLPDTLLIERVQEALRLYDQSQKNTSTRKEITLKINLLTAREREVLRAMIDGMGTKDVAAALHISTKTVDVHRGHILEKLHETSIYKLLANVAAFKDLL